MGIIGKTERPSINIFIETKPVFSLGKVTNPTPINSVVVKQSNLVMRLYSAVLSTNDEITKEPIIPLTKNIAPNNALSVFLNPNYPLN